MKKVIISHPTGNENSRNVVLGLRKHDMLSHFYTTTGIFSDSILQKLDNSFVREIKKRTYDASLRGYTSFHATNEIIRLLATKAKLTNLVKHEVGKFSTFEIYKDLDKLVSKKIQKQNANIIYGYADGSLESFKVAKGLNMKTVCDMQSCYYKKVEEICVEELNKNPEWAETINILTESEEKKAHSNKEFQLADHIVVASNFSKKALELYDGELSNIKVIPYGFPEPFIERKYTNGKKLKLLFVGKLSQQKGLSYLFDAVEEFKEHVELTIIGSKPLQESSILNNHLQKHRYLGTKPHNEVIKEMRLTDILLFPTLMDAFGMVITEAMAQGTPVICTENSAGPEIITNLENGWIVNAGNSEQIKEILKNAINSNIAEELGRNALQKASSYSWDMYQKETINFLNQLH